MNIVKLTAASADVHAIAEADVVIADLTDGDARVVYATGVAHGLGKAVIVVATAPLPFENADVVATMADAEAAAERVAREGRSPIRQRPAPLAGIVDSSAIDESVRRFLDLNRIRTKDDLGKLDLDALAAQPGVTRNGLHAFVRALARSGKFPNEEALQDFVIRRGIFL